MNETDMIGMNPLKYALLQSDIESHRENNASEKQDSNEKVYTDSKWAIDDETEKTDVRLVDFDVYPLRRSGHQKAINDL